MSLQVWLTGNNSMNNQGLLGELTQTTTPTYVDGKLGKAMSTGGYKMTAEQTAQVLNNEAVSICFWIYINAATGTTNNTVMFFGNGGMGSNNNRKFSLFNYPTVNDFHWSWMNDTANNTFAVGVLSGVLPSYKWTHVAITYQNPNGTIYINGEKVTTFTGVSNSSTFAYETQVIHNSSYLKWNDYRIYDECISAKTVKEISKGLVCHYKLSGVGGENVLTKTDLINKTSSDIWTKTGGVTVDSTNGRVTIPSSNTQQCEFYRNDWTTLEANTDYICSFYIHSNTLTPSQSNRYLTYWLACNNNGTTNWQFKTGNTNKTGLFYFTFNTGTYTQFRLDIGSDVKSTGSAVISKIKIEKGTKATPWCPNPSDTLYSTLGYNDGIEYDCSGYGNNGTKVGNIVWSGDSARYSGSYGFNGTGHIKTGFSATINELSCSFWVKPNSSNGGYAIIASNYNNPAGGFWIAVNCEGSGLWFYNGAYVRGRNPILSNDVWYHGVFTYNNGIGKWYLNGELDNTADISSRGTSLTISNLSIGNSFTGTTWNTKFYGNISDFRLYSKCLSADDVKSLYNVSASIDKTGVLSAYEFIEEG